MFKNAYRVFIVLACAIAGCSGSPKELPVAKSAHGGTMLTLPDGQSYAEVLVESAVVGKSAGKAQYKPKIVAYFFQADGTSVMSPGPTDVKIKIGMGENGRTVDLAPEPKEAGKYATAAGDYPEGFAGELEATVNGAAVQVPFRVR
jgi:hypothetical protein